MMADGGDCAPVTPRALEIEIGDGPERWAALGFALDGAACTVGGVRLVFAGGAPGIHRVGFEGLAAGHPDGLPLVAVPERPPTTDAAHPIGAVAVDQVVACTDDLDRTTGALEAAGLALRAVRRPYAFLPAGTLLIEVVETGAAPSLWGLVIAVADLDAAAARLGDRLGEARDAVQPGRRIATVRREAGLSTALALMTPRT
jgi:hypothetical protein